MNIKYVLYSILIGLFCVLNQYAHAEIDLVFSSDKVEKKGLLEIEWFKESKSDLSFFRIHSGLPEYNRLNINNILKNIHVEYVDFYQGCNGVISEETSNGFEELSTFINVASQNLLSFSVSLSYFCKGMARPYAYTENYLYDLNKLKLLKLKDILYFNNSPKREDKAYQELDTQNILSPFKIRELVFSKQNWDLNNPVENDSCDYKDLTVWGSNFVYTDQGIGFIPSFPTISAMCSYPFFIPFDQLSRFKKNSFYHRFEQ